VSHAKIVGGLTLASRFAGLARDATCSRVFGASPVWSAFAFAFLIPNLFRRLFGEGALSAAFLPIYTRLDESDPHQARRFAALVLGGMTIILAGIVLIGEVVLWLITKNYAGIDERSLALRLLMIMLPYMPLVCLVALLGAMLQVRGRFGPTAAAPVILNICIISAAGIGVYFINHRTDWEITDSIHLVAGAVLLAGFIQLAWSWLALRRTISIGTDELNTTLAPIRPHISNLWRTMLPMILGLGVLQLNTFLDGLIASYPILIGPTIFDIQYPLDESSNAIISFSQRLYQFPLGVFGIAVATAIFPALSRAAVNAQTDKNKSTFDSILTQGLRLTVFIGLPASIGLILVRTPLTTVVFRGGQFSSEDVVRVGAVLTAYAPAVCAYSLIHVLTRAYYALGDSMTPVRISVGMVALNLILNLTLIWPFGESGLAWSTSICAWLQVGLLLSKLQRSDIHPAWNETTRSWVRSFISTVIMAIAVIVAWYGFHLINPGEGWLMSLVELLVLTGVGLAVFIIMMRYVFKQPEFGWLMSRGKRGSA